MDHAEICDEFESVDGVHGRIEMRRALICHDLDWLNAHHDWPSLKEIGKVIATREKDGKTTTQICPWYWDSSSSLEKYQLKHLRIIFSI